jgi:Spy/CpxP family protein refolding chaperone
VKTLHEETMSKVNGVLTPEQRTELKEKLVVAKTRAPASNY